MIRTTAGTGPPRMATSGDSVCEGFEMGKSTRSHDEGPRSRRFSSLGLAGL
jgi:hypothetical protein